MVGHGSELAAAILRAIRSSPDQIRGFPHRAVVRGGEGQGWVPRCFHRDEAPRPDQRIGLRNVRTDARDLIEQMGLAIGSVAFAASRCRIAIDECSPTRA